MSPTQDILRPASSSASWPPSSNTISWHSTPYYCWHLDWFCSPAGKALEFAIIFILRLYCTVCNRITLEVAYRLLPYVCRFPHVEDHLEDMPMEDGHFMSLSDPPRPPSVIRSDRGGSRAPSVASGAGGRASSKPPSVVGSVDGYRNSRNGHVRQSPSASQQGVTPPRRPGSVTGSIEGRLANR